MNDTPINNRAPKKGNSSHTTRLAHAFKRESGHPYMRAKEIVERAARAGLLPEPIDVDEMRPALEVLRRFDKAGDNSGAGASNALTASTVTSGTAPHSPVMSTRYGADRHGVHVCQRYLETLHQVAQRRIIKSIDDFDPWGTQYTLDGHRLGRDHVTEHEPVVLTLLERDGYIVDRRDGEPLDITPFGRRVLDVVEVPSDPYERGLTVHTVDLLHDHGVHGHREPYVGSGADGARRSAAIDESEIDILPTGRHDPHWTKQVEHRRVELARSAARWRAQAAAIEQEEAIERLVVDRRFIRVRQAMEQEGTASAQAWEAQAALIESEASDGEGSGAAAQAGPVEKPPIDPWALLEVGDQVRFLPRGGSGQRWWTVRARDERFIVATVPAPFEEKGTVWYTVVDLTGWLGKRYNGAGHGVVRSSLNTLGGGWDIDADGGGCEEVLDGLRSGKWELSHRRVTNVDRFEKRG